MGNSAPSYIRELLVGSLIFIVIVVGVTSFLQSTLILVKHYDAYMHWAVVLFAVPAVTGIVLRLKKITSPLFSCLIGALGSAAILYPLYQSWWAAPPKIVDVVIYGCIVFGIGYISTQPLKATFMLAFRLGRYSVAGGNGKGRPRKTTKQFSTTRPMYTSHGSAVAVLELVVGICSLVLSVFSVFYMGRS